MAESSRWWENFFSGMMLDVRDYFTPEQTQAGADFLEKVLTPGPGARIADIPCGTGRLSLALAKKGYNITGVDSCSPHVDDAIKAATEQNLKIDFEIRDMRDLPWPAEFDHAFCFGNSFPYFHDAGNAEFLAAAARILKPGGKFALETGLAAESALTQQPRRWWGPFGDIYFLHETSYDPATAIWTSTYTLIRGGQVERKQAHYPIYTYKQFVSMFETAGFRDVTTYGSYDCEPYRLGSPDLLLVAARK